MINIFYDTCGFAKPLLKIKYSHQNIFVIIEACRGQVTADFRRGIGMMKMGQPNCILPGMTGMLQGNRSAKSNPALFLMLYQDFFACQLSIKNDSINLSRKGV